MSRLSVAVALLAMAAGCDTVPEHFDLIIRGGDVYDGASTTPQRVDVAIRGDRIAALGNLGTATASQVVDAAGLVVAPGFIDAQSHSGTTLLVDGHGESHVRQGVTTVLIGDEKSPAFWTAETADLDTLKPFGIDFDWTGIDGYFERLQQRGIAPNVGTLVPIAASAGTTAAIELAMRDGALGLSFSAPDVAPFRVSPEPLVSLARAVAAYDGVLAVVLEGSFEQVTQTLEDALQVAGIARVPLVVYQPPLANDEALGRVLSTIRVARARGIAVSTTMTPMFEGASLARSAWLRDSGASVGSQAAAVRAGSALERKSVQPRAYDAFASVLARYAREEQVISLGDAIRHMTSTPAAQFRIEDRGILRVGFAADVAIFDASTVNAHTTVEQPARYATGVRHVIVNGVPVLDGNGLTGARPGRAVLGRAGQPARSTS